MGNASISKDRSQRAPFQLLVQRHHKRGVTITVLEADMAATLSGDLPPEPFKRSDQARTRDDRQPICHVRTGRVRRITPVERY